MTCPACGSRDVVLFEVCVWEWSRRQSWPLTRQAVFDRDGGVCGACGLDTERVRREFRAAAIDRLGAGQAEASLTGTLAIRTEGRGRAARTVAYRPGPLPGDLVAAFAARYGLPASAFGPGRSLWDVDHVVPVADGGDWFDFGNLVTLCRGCHRAKTVRENRERAKAKRGRGPC